MQPCRGIAWRTHRDDDNHGRQVVYAAQLKLHRIDRSLCPENPRPKGGIKFSSAKRPPHLYAEPKQNKEAGIFVGIWVPSIISAGIFVHVTRRLPK